MKKLLLWVPGIMLFLSVPAVAQVGIGTTAPNTNSVLDLTSTNKGLLLPRFGLAGRPAGVNGLFYYQTDNTPGFYYYDGSSTAWTKVFTTQGGTLAGKLNTLASSVSGGAGMNLGIGLAPATPLDGDLWLTSLGLFARFSGTNVGPFGTGTVSSVGFSMPAQFTVSGSPVAGSGTITTSWVSQAQNSILGGPASGSGAPTFRTLVDGDIPNTITASNYLPLAGGTLTGKLNTVASSTTNAGLNLSHGAAPTTPVNGDIWTATTGLYARINGTTVGPLTSNTGTVTAVSTAAANNGVSATWSMASPTPALTIGLGAITPASIATGTGTFTGKVTTAASATGGAGIVLPHGAAPTTPTNGDVWTTTTGLFARINGTTVGPLTANTGTVTSVATGTGLTGGPITATGTVSMANMAANTVKGNNTAGTAAPADIAIATNQVLGRLASNIVGIPIGTAAGNVAAGNHTHSTMIDGTGVANKVAFWTDANTLGNNTNFHWNNANGRLGIGTTNPVGTLVAQTSQALSMTLQDWGQDENGLYREGLTVKSPNRGALIHLTTDYTPAGNEIYSEFNFQRARTGRTSVLQNDHLGAVSFAGFMQSYWVDYGMGFGEFVNQYMQTAAINAQVDGPVTSGSNVVQGTLPTCLTFHTTTSPGDYFYPQAIPERLRITSSGNVGINTTNPDQRFVVYNGSTTGRYTTTGWTHSSDARLKKNIKDLDNSLEQVLQLQGRRFDFINESSNASSHIGFIAQELETVYPEFVVTGADGYKSVAYGEMVSVLVEAIKEQQQMINALQKENGQLKAQVSRIDQIEAKLNQIYQGDNSKEMTRK